MSEVGTIVEIEPEDGLGWIEMPNGDRVRFGGTACKGFVPAIGMPVEVVGTKPGFRGVIKATELRKAAGGPSAAGGGAAAAAAVAPAAPVAVPRQALHTVQAAQVRADDFLLALLGRADVDDTLHADLEKAHFEVQPQPGPALGGANPWFYVVAMNGGGDAYGLYTHRLFDGQGLPWLFWDHETNTLRFIAASTSDLMVHVLGEALGSGADAASVERLRGNLVKLGMADVAPTSRGDAGEKVDWLPPDDAELRALDDYLAETDGVEMERGLLAHAFRRNDANARAALEQIYESWGWGLPAWT